MSQIADHRAILAIDPGDRGVGFVFFENGELLDWGTRGRGKSEPEVVDELLGRFRPDVLVLEDPTAPGSARRTRLRRVLRVIGDHARAHGVQVEMVSRHAVRSAWRERGERNKNAIATAIAAAYPDIAPFVPRKRRAWESEDARMSVFDAFSLLLHVRPAEAYDDGAPQAVAA